MRYLHPNKKARCVCEAKPSGCCPTWAIPPCCSASLCCWHNFHDPDCPSQLLVHTVAYGYQRSTHAVPPVSQCEDIRTPDTAVRLAAYSKLALAACLCCCAALLSYSHLNLGSSLSGSQAKPSAAYQCAAAVQAIKDEILGTGESDDEEGDGEEGDEDESGSEEEEQEQQKMQIQVWQPRSSLYCPHEMVLSP